MKKAEKKEGCKLKRRNNNNLQREVEGAADVFCNIEDTPTNSA